VSASLYVPGPMSSRSESKKTAREARLKAEQEEAAKNRRQRTWALVGGSVLLAAIVVVVLIVISAGGSDNSSESGNLSAFEGIPQSGIELGDPKAPVTMVEYADLQCPFCRKYTVDVLPDLVEKYVKTGDVRMELHLLTFIGPDSDKLARAAYAAGQQDLMWQWIDVAYARQETENSGYATTDFIDSVSKAAGANVDQVNSDSGSEEVTKQISEAESSAQDAGISSTPSFEIGPTGGELTKLGVSRLETSAFEDAIDQQVADAKK
jgi:protein-disulfide isomerase